MQFNRFDTLSRAIQTANRGDCPKERLQAIQEIHRRMIDGERMETYNRLVHRFRDTIQTRDMVEECNIMLGC